MEARTYRKMKDEGRGSSTDTGLRSFNDATDGERRRRLLSADFAADREKHHTGSQRRDAAVMWKQMWPRHVPEHPVFE